MTRELSLAFIAGDGGRSGAVCLSERLSKSDLVAVLIVCCSLARVWEELPHVRDYGRLVLRCAGCKSGSRAPVLALGTLANGKSARHPERRITEKDLRSFCQFRRGHLWAESVYSM